MLALAGGASCLSVRNPDTLGPPSSVPGTHEYSVHVGEDVRTYLLHVPPGPPRRFGIVRKYPLIILLHGSGADGQAIREESNMDSLADSGRFVVAYPNASTSILGRLRSDWNAGECCGSPAKHDVDDIGFLRELIRDLSVRLPVDSSRIYVAGFSDGGRMTYRVGCELADEVAAIGVVSGSLQDATCHPHRAVSLIAFHGTDDSEVPYADSLDSVAWPSTIPAAREAPPSLRFWANRDGCRGFTVRRVSAHVVRGLFQACQGADVVLYTIEGGSHGWTDDSQRRSVSPEPMHELATSEIMVQFLMRHSR
jgi:polyhydroxybutyrate depolymerase